ncbi:uncharacterized protein PHACADRAFT_190701 [Phanerochaete carnosa HHB-10118-sp]|uniref:Thioredoxin domain-containing protein n=1 Tax=Phanerochaete carnosa (strain HHB-10118-sp) TaxID=650164 RepID=K5WQK3_PHACS|nr:uncharacterized protein PHACADRAFT_190701 [Phanerochaete carnosa HHB-10118-sp]EKM61529.1 hypothetical protein PHACADRAFT_190701 [Phanerochaete carnosa HHB-10118-sp]
MEGIPDESAISKAAELTVLDLTGQNVKFGDLFEDKKIVVIFIRHFFCGNCQAYVSQLAAVEQEAFDKAGVSLLIIGCGDYQPIKNYADNTGFRGPIYADPTRALYHHFGLIENLNTTPADEEKKSYLAGQSRIGNALGSIWRGPLKNPHHMGKQGNISQLGGEFIFGPGNRCSYASRMKHTEDHVEVAELMKEAGVEYH